jgi:hypothetical protein
MDGRLFTVGEANNLLPELEVFLTQIQKARRFLYQCRGEIQKAKAKAELGGGSPKGPSYLKSLEFIIKRLEKIQGMGVLVKDIERGLCDFPFMRDGQVVYLCWKLGENEVQWWHSTDTGFSGRKHLDHEEE